MRLYRAFLNIGSSLFRNFFGLILGFVATPLLLSELGDEVFGAFRALLDLVAQLGILEFGLYAALLPLFSKALTLPNKPPGAVPPSQPTQDDEELPSHTPREELPQVSPAFIEKQACYKYLQVILLQTLGLGILYLFLDKIIPVSPELQKDLHRGYLILGGSILFSFTQIYRAFLDASQRGYILSMVMTLQNAVSIGLSLVLAYIGWGLPGQSLGFVIASGVTLFAFLILSKQKIRDASPSSSIPENAPPPSNHSHGNVSELRVDPSVQRNLDHAPMKATIQKALKRQRTPHFIVNLCGRTSLTVDNLVVSFFWGASAIIPFYLTQRLVQIAFQQLQQLGNSTWPAMSELYHRKEYDYFAERIVDITEFIACIAGCGLSTLIIINPSFISLWTGPETFAGLNLSNLAILTVGFHGINSFWHWCFNGTGLVKKTLPMFITQALVNVIISIVATKYLGIIGPILGTFIAFAFITQPWTLVLMKREFNISIHQLNRAWMMPFLLPVCLSIAITYNWGPILLNHWWQWVVLSGALLMTTLIVFPLLFVRKKSRQEIQKRVLQMVRRRVAIKK